MDQSPTGSGYNRYQRSGSDIVILDHLEADGPPSYADGHGEPNGVVFDLSILEREMSLTDALTRLRDLMKENQELKDALQTNNTHLKEQFGKMEAWQQKVAGEHKMRCDQAREVVMDLRQQLNDKKQQLEVTQNQLQIARRSSEKSDTGAQDMESENMSTMAACLREAQTAKANLEEEIKDLRREMEDSQQRLMDISVSQPESSRTDEDETTCELRKKNRLLKEMLQKSNKEKSNLQCSVEQGLLDQESLKESYERLKSQSEHNARGMQMMKNNNDKLLEEKRHLLAENSELRTKLILKSSSGDNEDSMGSINLNSFGMNYVVVEGSTDEKVASSSAQANQGVPNPIVCREGAQQESGEERKTMSELLLQIQEERDKVESVMERISRKDKEIEELKADKSRLEASLIQDQTFHDQAIKQLSEKHQQAAAQLMKRLEEHQKAAESQSSTEQQIQLLRQEMAKLEAEVQKYKMAEQATRVAQGKLEIKCSDLQDRLDHSQSELKSQRSRDEQLISSLRLQISNNEGIIAAERQERERIRVNHESVCETYERLVGDYRTLYQKHEDSKKQQEAALQKERINANRQSGDSKILREQVDNLTAQLFNAEEALATREEEVGDLKEKLKEASDKGEMIKLYEEQATIYKHDFEQERQAREAMNADKVKMEEFCGKLKEEYEHLYGQKKRLEEEYKLMQAQMQNMQEVQAGVPNQISKMQERYGALGGRPSQPGGFQGASTVPRDFRAGHYDPEPSMEEHQRFECPMCGQESPDLDSLQIHTLDCIK